MDKSPIGIKRLLARAIGAAVVIGAAVALLVVWRETNRYPRTDDAWVLANLIGIAPEVSGTIQKLNIRDNQSVKAGDLLFEIDPRPFQYALERARSEQSALEGQISNQERAIAAQRSGVNSAQASVTVSEASVAAAEANVNASRAGVLRSRAALASAEAESALATSTLHRLEPLLIKQFITAEDVDRARTQQRTAEQNVAQAQSALALSEAQLKAVLAQQNEAVSNTKQSEAQLEQSMHNVMILDPLVAQREGRAATIRSAQYDLDHSRIYAPFDARVTNMNISLGAYAHAGTPVFTLIDTRKWYVVGNFRESQLIAIQVGMPVDVYVMSKPTQRFTGVVESASYGVTPQDVTSSQGLQEVQRSLNWVHLATRIPVRILVEDPSSELFRIGESAVVIVRGGKPL